MGSKTGKAELTDQVKLCGGRTLLFTEKGFTVLVFAGQRGKGKHVNIPLHVMQFLQKGQKKLATPVFLQ